MGGTLGKPTDNTFVAIIIGAVTIYVGYDFYLAAYRPRGHRGQCHQGHARPHVHGRGRLCANQPQCAVWLPLQVDCGSRSTRRRHHPGALWGWVLNRHRSPPDCTAARFCSCSSSSRRRLSSPRPRLVVSPARVAGVVLRNPVK